MKKTKWIKLILLALLVATTVFVGCDKRSTDVPDLKIVSMSVSDSTMFADNDNSTSITITATVADAKGNSAVGKLVSFSCPASFGSITTEVMTNEKSEAIATFNDKGVISENVLITASISNSSMNASLKIKSVPEYSIASLIASPEAKLYADNNNETYLQIMAFVQNVNGFGEAGINVNFKLNDGSINNATLTSSAITNGSGIATALFYDHGIMDTLVVVSASVDNSELTIPIRIEEAPQFYIEKVEVSSDVIYQDNDNATFATVKAFVRNSDGTPAEGIDVNFLTNLGVIELIATSDIAGVASVKFDDNGDVGDADIIISIKNAQDAIIDQKYAQIEIAELPELDIALTLSSDTMSADNDPETYVEVTAIVTNSGDGYPVADYPVEFKVANGLGIIPSVQNTDINGVSTVNFLDIGQTGIATIEAKISSANSVITAETTINITNPPSFHIEWIKAFPNVIYQDNNVTYSEVRVYVKDEEGYGVGSQLVRFQSDIGNIITNAYTDSTGIVTTTFYDSGDLGEATILANVGTIDTTITVTIEEQPELESITLSPAFTTLIVDDVITIMASGQTEIGDVPDGTNVTFHTSNGFFQDSEGVAVGSNTTVQTIGGSATVILNAGTGTTIDGLLSISIDEMTVENEFIILPGMPKYMNLIVMNSSGEIVPEVNVNGEQLTVQATIEDLYHNLVNAGKSVLFETTLGTIDPLTAVTDENGVALTYFSPGIIAGIAEISAASDSAMATSVVTITSDEVHSIEFDFDGQIQLDVQGTGGQEHVDLKVNLYDTNGNLISGQKDVWFQFELAPEGTSIDNQIYFDPMAQLQDSLSVTANNGVAMVTVNSGLFSGNVTVRASVNAGAIHASKPNIVVQAGPPSSVEFAIGGNDSGEDMGSGMWKVQCSAQITDDYGNPVKSGTVCWFSLPDNPDWASIDAASFVGNENANGDSLAGQAFTFLNYHGSHTNEEIQIQVDVSAFSDTGNVVLPVQFPQINLAVNPQHIDWTQTNNPSSQIATAIIQVLDGQNIPIDNMELYFQSDKGEPVGGYTDYTAVVDGIHGRLDKDFLFYKYECPAPTPAGPGETSATLTVRILATGTQNTIDVILRRYFD